MHATFIPTARKDSVSPQCPKYTRYVHATFSQISRGNPQIMQHPPTYMCSLLASHMFQGAGAIMPPPVHKVLYHCPCRIEITCEH